MKNKGKTYCGSCKYLRQILHPTKSFVIKNECTRFYSIEKDFFNSTKKYGNPEKINKNNDCEYYKKHWFDKLLFWIKD